MSEDHDSSILHTVVVPVLLLLAAAVIANVAIPPLAHLIAVAFPLDKGNTP